MKKLAIIRTDDTIKCPFGLEIPIACKTAGESISKMIPISESSNDEHIQSNIDLYIINQDGQHCVFGNKIFKDSVECSFNDVNTKNAGILSSLFYSRVMNNTSIDGLYSYPLGYYADMDISRNLYYGLYSIQSSNDEKDIEKFAKYIENINDKIDSFDKEIKNVLISFANDVDITTNNGLLKKAKDLNSLTKIAVILSSWKGLK